MKIIIFLCLLFVIILVFYYAKLHKQPVKSHSMPQEQPKRIDQRFECPEGVFSIVGTKDNFSVSKGDRFTFFVKNGRITAFQDRTVSDEVIKYGGDSNVTA